MRQRSEAPVPEIDREEEQWWNDNAGTVEAIWAMSENVRPAVRSHYLERARRFFLEGSTQRPVKMLEVGCGSGWVGRMLAERGQLHIVGLDIAEEQIRLAKENARKAGLDDICEYRCQNLADFTVNDAQSVSCVFIHAILHHLSWQEIRSVLTQLKELGAGTRLFIYEPVYLSNPEGSELPQSREAKMARSVAALPQRLTQVFQKVFRPARDRKLVKEVEALAVAAQKQGRILSPKEVVFQEHEILAALNDIGDVTERYLCNFTSIPSSQFATALLDAKFQRLFARTVLPVSRWIDTYLFEKGKVPLVTREYVFMGYHCVIR